MSHVDDTGKWTVIGLYTVTKMPLYQASCDVKGMPDYWRHSVADQVFSHEGDFLYCLVYGGMKLLE